MSKCLVCFGDLSVGDYHPACSRRLFGKTTPLVVDLLPEALPQAALQFLGRRGGVAGVQTKLSLGTDPTSPQRLPIVGWNRRFILKPPSPEFAGLPENEALCMELAHRLSIPTAPHGLVRMGDGGLAYLSRRFDRPSENVRWHQEDFCQLAERPTADKYKGSLEAAGKLLRYSRQPGLDAVRFLELNLFCWLTGNADMHLKNFSLLRDPSVGWVFSPAYDLVSTALALPEDKDETALTLNGKKAKLKKDDWAMLAGSLGVPVAVLDKLWRRLEQATVLVEDLVSRAPSSVFGRSG